MPVEFTGIERRLDELSARLTRLRPLSEKPRQEFDQDPLLRDVVERNLQIAVQCCIDISHRIGSREGSRKLVDDMKAMLVLGELGVLPPSFARRLAPLASLRNILAREYLDTDWDRVYANLRQMDEMEQFAVCVRKWLANQLAARS
jgi:uncharacterized protein YutE (UPF0331/DUF86 family)